MALHIVARKITKKIILLEFMLVFKVLHGNNFQHLQKKENLFSKEFFFVKCIFLNFPSTTTLPIMCNEINAFINDRID